MFRSQPKKNVLLDQLDVQIEEHQRISKILDKEYEQSRHIVEKHVKKGLKRAAKMAYDGLKDVKNKLEANEITVIQLRRVRTQLLAQPDRLPTKTIQGVDQLLKASQKQIVEAQVSIMPILERARQYTDATLTTTDLVSDEVDDEFEEFLSEAGLGEPKIDSEEEIAEPLPEVPWENRDKKIEDKDKPKKEIKEDAN